MSVSVNFEILYWGLAENVLLLNIKALHGNRSNFTIKSNLAQFQEISM